MAEQNTFAGDRKVGGSILSRPEKALVAAYVGRLPAWLETYHLTALTALWSLGVLGFGFLARDNRHWLWLVSLMIVLQYLTDLYDGAVGRLRGTGLVKWGFFMDHFLDYVFLCSLVAAYGLLAPPGLTWQFMLLLALTGGFMVHSFLSFAATNQFQIYFYGFGPTETRIGFILVNTLLIWLGTDGFRWAVPLVNAACAVGLGFLVWRTHRRLWAIDMEAKAAASRPPAT